MRGWHGLVIGKRYLVLRRASLYPLRWSERERRGAHRLARFGDWQVWWKRIP